MARLAAHKKDPGFPEDVFRKLTGDQPQSLAEIAKDYRVPKGEFTRWFQEEHSDLYDSALKSVTDEMIFAAKSLLDDATEDSAALVKVRVDGYLKLASKWDRMRYGDTVRVERSAPPGADAELIGTMGVLLELVARGQRPMRIVGEASAAAEAPPPADAAPARLPAAQLLI